MGESYLSENKLKIQFEELITTTGLQIKSDSGVFVVYLSFLLLMISIYTSFLTYSQIWILEGNENVIIAGKSNRAVLFFQEEFRRLVRISKGGIKTWI